MTRSARNPQLQEHFVGSHDRHLRFHRLRHAIVRENHIHRSNVGHLWIEIESVFEKVGQTVVIRIGEISADRRVV